MKIRWRGLELPSRVAVDRETRTETYGRFVAEPFERGFGASVGNSLRRILLSSLEGSAVTRVRILGVQHEFTTIPGVVEDVSDICLNLKSLVVKNYSASSRTLRIEKNTRGVVTGADIICDDQVLVINRDLVIATLTDDVPFEVEMTVENGRGFVPASEQYQHEPEVGIIPLDATFSPVTRVRHLVEEARVGQRTNYEKLTIEIWTNGTVDPEMGMVEAAKILRKHLSCFITFREPGPEDALDSARTGPVVDMELEEKLGKSLAELNLSVRATNCLESVGINTVRDLVVRSEDELLQVRNFGETTLDEVRDRLVKIDLRLGMRLPNHSR